MINDPGNPQEAYSCAVDILSRRDRSEKDLYDRLIEKGFEGSAAAEALKKLKEKHYIDDVRMASHFIATHMSQQSITQLRYKLIQKGISAEDIATAISIAGDEAEDEGESLRVRQSSAVLGILRKKKYDSSAPSAEKILASIYRKGFSYDIIRESIALYEKENIEEQ